jgi:hypothetical protein|tara:strand:+ start:993 stop:1538 length:546 start_codon:yes stop_codon:yes gene_type:complete
MIENPRITAPIPGQSLTGEPRQYAWERPPEYDTPEEALKFYLPKITDDETVDDIHLVLESGFPLSTLVKGIYMNGVMDGLHSIDVGLLIAPVLHEVIKASAKTNQIEFKEVPVSETERLEEKERRRLELSVERFLEQTKDEDEGTQFVMGATQAAQQDMPVQEEMPQQEEQPSGGLMSRSE